MSLGVGSRIGPRLRRRGQANQAELVSLRIGHHDPPDVAHDDVVFGLTLRSEPFEATGLCIEIAVDVEIEMHSILAPLRFANLLQHEPGLVNSLRRYQRPELIEVR